MPEQRDLVDVYSQQRTSLTEALLRAILGIWFPFRWFGRPDMVNAYAAASAARVDAAMGSARQAARVFALQTLGEMDARPSPRSLKPVEVIYPRANVTPLEVYKRPARQAEYAISQGATVDEAVIVMTDRIESIVATDIATVTRDEIAAVYQQAPKVIGFRRVIHPELSKTGTCGLCIAASDQFYTRDDLLDLHGECKCETLPITPGNDPGQRINRADLDQLYAAAGSTAGEDLKRVRVQTVEHGELGPMLIPYGGSFRTVDDVNALSGRTRARPYKRPTIVEEFLKWEAMQASSERSIVILQKAKADGTNLVDIAGLGKPIEVKDLDLAIKYHRELIARAAQKLRL